MRIHEEQVSISNDYSHENQEAAFTAFKQAYPSFETTRKLDELRASEYSRLYRHDQVYLDYTGGGLYSDYQIREHMKLLQDGVFGNPHSNNPTSMAMTRLVEGARAYILKYFNTSPDEYVVIFTLNASGALKLVGESYPFGPGSQYLLTFDNHNSVNGIREFARQKGALVTYIPLTKPDLRMDLNKLSEHLDQVQPGSDNLFAYPAQSNFSGVQHPLELIAQAQAKGWDVLVDCAAFAPTNRLDLSRWHPDYVALSFYKIFGYPTGIGCLLVRKAALPKLKRPWFAGGTIILASVQAMKHSLHEDEAAFEDGTINYLGIPAVEIGLHYIESINIDTIHERVLCLTGWLLKNLFALKHSNGTPMIRIYGPTNTHLRGGTITLNFYDPDKKLMDYRRVEELANEANISLRTGCFCNPGVGEISESVTLEEINEGFTPGERMTFPAFRSHMQKTRGKGVGAIRISTGLATTFPDVYRFMRFAQSFTDKSIAQIGTVEFNIETCRVTRDSS